MRLLLLLGILLYCANYAIADTDPNDASALRDLYRSLKSPEQLAKWNANGGDPCGESWTGITCSGNRVSEINLSGFGLSGSLGYQLANLTSVTNLDISNNNFGNQLSYPLPPNVQRLNVSHNRIQGQVTVAFDSLSSLNTLDFSFNAMTGDLPQSFKALSSMKKMYLQNNQFTGTIDVLANLPLDDLNVENNHFTGWIPDHLKEITKSNGNSWNSGPAPPASRPHYESGGNNSPSDGGGKSRIVGGAVAGIVISVLLSLQK